MEMKRGKKIALFFGCILGVIGMIGIGQLFGMFFVSVPNVILENINPKLISPAWITAKEYIYFIGIWLVALSFLYFSPKNRPILKVIGRNPKGNTWSKFGIGILLGFGLNGVCVFIAWISKGIQLEYVGFHPISFVIIFLCILVQSSAEELLCRGFLYQKGIQYFHKPVIAILANSMLFAFLHLLNNGVTIISIVNIFMSGIMSSLIVYYCDSMWCAFAEHTAWNFTQNILFGLPNSGIVVPYSVFKLNADTAKNSFAYNVNFGIEGTIVADIVLALACIAIFVWGRKRGNKPYDVWQTDDLTTNKNE